MAALSLSAVDSLGWESGVTLSADHLVTLELPGEGSECWLDLHGSHTTSSESEHQVESGLLLDVVIREGSSIFQLLSSEDESLLIGGDALLILDLGPIFRLCFQVLTSRSQWCLLAQRPM